MSRIAGLLTENDEHARERQVEAMLRDIRSDDRWSFAGETAAGVAVGWTGWSGANLARRNGVVAVVDGSFFNREDLTEGDSDADRLIGLFHRLGFERAVARLNGDFALALYDERDECLYLARDRVGAKPLYYSHACGDFAFGSRLRSLLALPQVSAEIDRQYVAVFAGCHYRYFDNDPGRTPFSEIHQLPAGHVLRLRHGQAFLARYWSLEEAPDWDASEEDLAERYRELLLDAVGRRLHVAIKPGFTLSGGMDSSSVLACAVRVSGRKQHALSTVYHDKTYDESDEIRSMLEATVEQWHTVALGTPEVVDTVARMVSVHDEPVATATWLSHFQLCQSAAATGFGSLFGGLGGDELNAGEYEYFLYHFADLVQSGQQASLPAEIDRWIEYHDHPVFRKSHELVASELTRLTDCRRPGHCMPETGRLRRYHQTVSADYFDLAGFLPVMDHPFRSCLKNRTYQDLFRETAPCCLRAEDRQATAFGLENFLPFFDHRLIEFMYRVPGRLKIRGGVTKILLRQAMRGILPEETRTRIQKTGWNAPAHVWFSGDGQRCLHDLVGSQAFRERGIYDLRQVRRLITEHDEIMRDGRLVENHMMFLWQLVNLEMWLRYVDDLSRAARYRMAS